MTTLREALGSGDIRKAVIKDACQVLDQEVSDKSGLTGMAVKAAFAVVKGVKAGFIPEVVDALLNDFLDALEPLHAAAISAGMPPGRFLKDDPGRAAEALLAVTDRRAMRAERGVVAKTYEKLRPAAKKHVESAMPRLAEMLARHLRSEN
ncbi:MAG: hypothetical protein RJA70_2014 [Pseudomonadota bacterium]|jgi:hypothetical protein